ncbi:MULTISPECIES: hypothetical protein [Halocynthiibacter]|uniref:Uncharacterized protein n=1 Tax=Halocynthiibacter styelae TaxID=2761955 RepID=A0A8J7LR48_9RHOB|nr:hypothetical protein [Paenihalocynthiibacter styelae]MBI1495182.1 hypothetical protein [Paenihalocynthiibacter styelae]
MGLGDLIGAAVNAFGGTDEIVSKIADSGIDMSALADLDIAEVPAMLSEYGIDMSLLENLGISTEDVIEKVKEHLLG